VLSKNGTSPRFMGRVFSTWIVVDSVAIQRVVILASRWLGVVVALT